MVAVRRSELRPISEKIIELKAFRALHASSAHRLVHFAYFLSALCHALPPLKAPYLVCIPACRQ